MVFGKDQGIQRDFFFLKPFHLRLVICGLRRILFASFSVGVTLTAPPLTARKSPSIRAYSPAACTAPSSLPDGTASSPAGSSAWGEKGEPPGGAEECRCVPSRLLLPALGSKQFRLARSPDVFPATRKIRAPSSVWLAQHRSSFSEDSSFCLAPFCTSCGLLLLPQPALDLVPREQEGRSTFV